MDTKVKKPAKSQAMSADTMMQLAVKVSRRGLRAATVELTGVTSRVTFGLVSMQVEPQARAQVKLNVVQGQKALARARNKILRPGVKISERKGIPLFSADPKQPEFLIRKLDGKTQRGTIINGKFKVDRAAGSPKTAKAT